MIPPLRAARLGRRAGRSARRSGSRSSGSPAPSLLQLPGPDDAAPRRAAVDDRLQRLNELAPPRTVLRALARVDPFPQIAGPAPPIAPPDRRVLALGRASARARPSVVRIIGDRVRARRRRLGLGRAAARRRHRGARRRRGRHGHPRRDGHAARRRSSSTASNDIAVLRVPGLRAPPLRARRCAAGRRRRDPRLSRRTARSTRGAGRVGSTADVLVDGALREVTALRGLVRHGNSGGPAVDAAGAVEATVFAARIGTRRRLRRAARRSSAARSRRREAAGLDRRLLAELSVEQVERASAACTARPRRRRRSGRAQPARSSRAMRERRPARRVRARVAAARPAACCGTTIPGTSLCSRSASAMARQREDARRAPGSATSRRAARANRSSTSRSNTICVIANCAPASTLRRKRSASTLEVVGGRVDRDADEERRRRVDRAAVEVLAAVQRARSAASGRSSRPRRRRASPGSRRPRAGRR